jgi:hypothetical protein
MDTGNPLNLAANETSFPEVDQALVLFTQVANFLLSVEAASASRCCEIPRLRFVDQSMLCSVLIPLRKASYCILFREDPIFSEKKANTGVSARTE